MNVEKNRQNKPLIPQKFLQSIMFLLCMCHTTAITYKFLSLLFSLISTANPVSVMKTGVYCVHITTAGNITGNPLHITGNPILITVNPVYVTENPVFILRNPVFITGNPVFITGNPVFTTGNY